MPKASKPAAVKPSKPRTGKPAAVRAVRPTAKASSRKSVTDKQVVAKPKLPRSSALDATKPVKPEPVKAKPAKAKSGRPAPALAKLDAAKPKPDVNRAKASKLPASPAPSKRLDTAAKLRPIEQAVGVSSDAVARRTGKSWAEWFALLDAAGAPELDHKGIVAVLAQRHGVGPWWQQMVTVAYEKARGMREHQESDEGYKAAVIKTLELPLAKLYRLWAEPSERNKWLADDRFSIHKATASKSIRARWGRGVSRIDVEFCEKGPSKSQVTVQHNRIETSDAAEQMKAYWAKKIIALEALLTRD
jgi:hypothetical protein